jgi:hypothetical protein
MNYGRNAWLWFYLAAALGCGGAPFSATAPLSEDAAADGTSGGALVDAPAAAEAEATTPDAGDAAGDVAPPDPPRDAAQGDAGELAPDAGDASADASPDVDGGALPCDPAYGDASPGGPCCVHVWATPTMGGVLCTVDGSRWCWQSGSPCSGVGSRCVTQQGVTYCAP